MKEHAEASSAAIWLYAFGYFAAYAPYAALTKALTSGMMGLEPRTGLQILPLSTGASLVRTEGATLARVRAMSMARSRFYQRPPRTARWSATGKAAAALV